MGSKCRQMVEPVEGHQTHNLVVAAEITRQVGIQTMSATDFLILPSPQPWPRAMLQGAHWGRRDSGTCLVTLGYVEHQCKFLSPGLLYAFILVNQIDHKVYTWHDFMQSGRKVKSWYLHRNRRNWKSLSSKMNQTQKGRCVWMYVYGVCACVCVVYVCVWM